MKNLANNNILPVGVCTVCWVFYCTDYYPYISEMT